MAHQDREQAEFYLEFRKLEREIDLCCVEYYFFELVQNYFHNNLFCELGSGNRHDRDYQRQFYLRPRGKCYHLYKLRISP